MFCPQGLPCGLLATAMLCVCHPVGSHPKMQVPRWRGLCVEQLSAMLLCTSSRPPSHGFIPFARHRIWPCSTQEGLLVLQFLCPSSKFASCAPTPLDAMNCAIGEAKAEGM
ncbi:hypothetical protein BDU57DRAFT_520122 [Ampelomyces quisqualis]|uniref:Secreted protein n=1 Tax=Ampelomyces quisqualis TaxID=50730 RepID=A0A6A5QGN7_AMPQU|nr:hypothetical protein BDU57DRAFT_520122 [Ampelomyces quisqualis]